MQFTKKPVTVEAVQFDGTLLSLQGFALAYVTQDLGSKNCQIPTLEGEMTARPGDWIIRGVQGEFYPCRQDIFEATYEPATASLNLGGSALADGVGDVTCDQCIELEGELHREYARQAIAATRTAASLLNDGEFRSGMETACDELETRLALGSDQTSSEQQEQAREDLWVTLLVAAKAYLKVDIAPAIMIGLGDGQTFLGLGTKAQFTLMCDGRSGAQIERDRATQAATVTGATAEASEDARDASWQPVTRVGQVRVGDKLRFKIGDADYRQRVKQVLHAGRDDEEVIYDKGRNYYFITSMVMFGRSNHKNVEFLASTTTKG